MLGDGVLWLPLHLHATKVYINPVEFSPNFVAHVILKAEWARLMELANKVPKGPIHRHEYVEKFLGKMHHILQEVGVLEGTLQCPGSSHVSSISCGIPNLLLSDKETEPCPWQIPLLPPETTHILVYVHPVCWLCHHISNP